MISKFGSLALSISLVALFFAAPLAHALAPQADTTEQAMAVYSKFKTFGDLAQWLQAYELASDTELHGVEAILKRNNLGFQSEITKGVFTPKRLTWDDVYLAKTLSGDWKTIGGRILVAHSETSVDGLFEQAMKTFDPKNAQMTHSTF